MRKLYCLFGLFLSSHFLFASVIEGRIDGQVPNILVFLEKSPIVNIPTAHRVEVKNQKFRLQLDTDRNIWLVLALYRREIVLKLAPQETINLEILIQNYEPVFTIKNSLFNQYYQKIPSLHSFNKAFQSLSWEQILTKTDSVEQAFAKSLEKMELADKKELQEILGFRLKSALIQYILSKEQPIETFGKAIPDFDFTNPKLIEIPDFEVFARYYLPYWYLKTNKEAQKDEMMEIDFQTKIYQFVPKYFSGFWLEYWQAKIIFNHLQQAEIAKDFLEEEEKKQIETQNKEMLQDFSAKSTQKAWKTELEKFAQNPASYPNFSLSQYHLQEGFELPNFRLKTTKGEDFDLYSLKGKTVLIDFWASWCAPCIAQFPYSKKLSERYQGKEIVFLFVSLDEEEKNWQEAIKKHKPEGINVRVDKSWDSDMAKVMGVTVLPTYYLLDKEGKISFKIGKPSEPQTQEIIDRILK